MMGQWSLRGLRERLDRIAAPVHLLAAADDRTVPPSTARRMAARIPDATWELLPGLGHLAHEEDAALIATHIAAFGNRLQPALPIG